MEQHSLVEPWLSVVTVVKDASEDFLRSLASLQLQDLQGVEYVVVDSSSDPTAIRQAFDACITQQPEMLHAYLWVEPEGIYAAMNTALAAAHGKYVYFLNSGDRFHSETVLHTVRQIAEQSVPLWMYGEVEIVELSGQRVTTPRWDYAKEQAVYFSRGHFPPHQGTFADRDALLALGGFDTHYSVVADYAAFLQLSKSAAPVYLDLVVAEFIEGGLSTTKRRASLSEFHRARKEILQPQGLGRVRESLESLRLRILTEANLVITAVRARAAKS